MARRNKYGSYVPGDTGINQSNFSADMPSAKLGAGTYLPPNPWRQSVPDATYSKTVRSENELRYALSEFARANAVDPQPRSIQVVSNIKLTEPIAINSSDFDRLSIRGVGYPLISSSYENMPIFNLGASGLSVGGLRVAASGLGGSIFGMNSRTELVGSDFYDILVDDNGAPVDLFDGTLYTSGSFLEYPQIRNCSFRNISGQSSNLGPNTNFLGCSFYGCRFGDIESDEMDQCLFTGCFIGSVTPSGSQVFTGNCFCGCIVTGDVALSGIAILDNVFVGNYMSVTTDPSGGSSFPGSESVLAGNAINGGTDATWSGVKGNNS